MEVMEGGGCVDDPDMAGVAGGDDDVPRDDTSGRKRKRRRTFGMGRTTKGRNKKKAAPVRADNPVSMSDQGAPSALPEVAHVTPGKSPRPHWQRSVRQKLERQNANLSSSKEKLSTNNTQLKEELEKLRAALNEKEKEKRDIAAEHKREMDEKDQQMKAIKQLQNAEIEKLKKQLHLMSDKVNLTRRSTNDVS